MRKKTAKNSILGSILLAILLVALVGVAVIFVLGRQFGFDLFSSGESAPSLKLVCVCRSNAITSSSPA